MEVCLTLVGFASSKCMLDQNISMHWDLDFPDALCIFCGCARFGWRMNHDEFRMGVIQVIRGKDNIHFLNKSFNVADIWTDASGFWHQEDIVCFEYFLGIFVASWTLCHHQLCFTGHSSHLVGNNNLMNLLLHWRNAFKTHDTNFHHSLLCLIRWLSKIEMNVPHYISLQTSINILKTLKME